MISGLEQPTTGEVFFDERPMSKVADRRAQRRLRVPELRDLHAHVGVREPRVRAQVAAAPRAGRQGARSTAASRRSPRPSASSAALDRAGRAPVRERPAEGRARALDDHGADDLPARRAVLEPRLGVPRVHARRAQAHPARGRPDDGVRDARSGRGDGHGRPDRGHGSRVSCSSTARRRTSTSGPRTRSSPASSARC